MPIYTRTGDKGLTSFFGGKRTFKCDRLIDVYGSIDELNSWVGLLAADTKETRVQKFLRVIQADLFIIGSTLSGWKGDVNSLSGRVVQMEHEIDKLEKRLSPLHHFILPGGSLGGARAHITRSICRRVERQLVALAQKESVNPVFIQYLNRLSDLLFMFARFINKNARVEEIIWIGEPRRKT